MQARQRRPPTVSPHAGQLMALDSCERSRGSNGRADSTVLACSTPSLSAFMRTRPSSNKLATGMVPSLSTQVDHRDSEELFSACGVRPRPGVHGARVPSTTRWSQPSGLGGLPYDPAGAGPARRAEDEGVPKPTGGHRRRRCTSGSSASEPLDHSLLVLAPDPTNRSSSTGRMQRPSGPTLRRSVTSGGGRSDDGVKEHRRTGARGDDVATDRSRGSFPRHRGRRDVHVGPPSRLATAPTPAGARRAAPARAHGGPDDGTPAPAALSRPPRTPSGRLARSPAPRGLPGARREDAPRAEQVADRSTELGELAVGRGPQDGQELRPPAPDDARGESDRPSWTGLPARGSTPRPERGSPASRRRRGSTSTRAPTRPRPRTAVTVRQRRSPGRASRTAPG